LKVLMKMFGRVSFWVFLFAVILLSVLMLIIPKAIKSIIVRTELSQKFLARK